MKIYMNSSEDFSYMSIIEAVSDVSNTFLSRRELICNFTGLGGKLNKLEAIDMITKEFKLDGKLVIPMRLKNHVGKSLITGTFFVYEDEKLAKSHVNPTIFNRLDKAKKSKEESEAQPEEAQASETPEEKQEAPEKQPEEKQPEKQEASETPAEKQETTEEKPAEQNKSEEKSE